MHSVLIVEAHAEFRHLLKLILSSHFTSLSIVEAKTGKAALTRIQNFKPIMCFIDVNLPDENGFILTKHIKAKHPATTVIIITAYDLPEYRQAAIAAGASYNISKGSFNEAEILKIVESIIALTF